MVQQPAGPLSQFASRFYNYLPTLAAGLVVLALGVALGWLVKRMTVRLLIWLRLDRLATRVGWRASLGKGDIRFALYDVLGAIGMGIVILIFLDNALQILGLTVLVRMIDAVVVYLPNLLVAGLIVGAGVAVAGGIAGKVEDALQEEGFSRPRLLAAGVKSLLLTIVGALALWQLGFAREIVLAAFLIVFASLGLALALAAGLGSAKAIQRAMDALFEKKKE
jgi:hypothetical protein